MNVYVEGQIEEKSGVQEQLEKLGYQVSQEEHSLRIKKNTQIESVVNELVSVIEYAGINVWDVHLKEYEKNSQNLMAEYEKGKIKRYN